MSTCHRPGHGDPDKLRVGGGWFLRVGISTDFSIAQNHRFQAPFRVPVRRYSLDDGTWTRTRATTMTSSAIPGEKSAVGTGLASLQVTNIPRLLLCSWAATSIECEVIGGEQCTRR